MDHTTFALLLLTMTLATLATTVTALLWAAITVLCESGTVQIATPSTAPIGRKSRPTMYRLPMAARTAPIATVTRMVRTVTRMVRIVTRIVTRDRLSLVPGYGYLPVSLVERYRQHDGWLDCVALDAALERPALERPALDAAIRPVLPRPSQWRSIGDPLGDMLAA